MQAKAVRHEAVAGRARLLRIAAAELCRRAADAGQAAAAQRARVEQRRSGRPVIRMDVVRQREHAPAPALVEELPPLPGAARHARGLVTDFCARHDLGALIGPASLIAAELVGNVVDHAHTMMTMRIAMDQERFLYVGVRDGSTTPPELRLPDAAAAGAAGRGLHLVQAFSDSWGHRVDDGGKTVWALLRLPG
ncbi:ATP-binding protein [Actinoplanes sp. NPDC023714]|uniref:ATP-binding protein n=1 Tax=Actinoplanes sp. NPDC023714 TaxID=3154322 RepID=UPI0033FFCA36